ncbi:Non-structural maintenance of chromosome element 4 [Suillus tomentosus]|nr:Non-structural maintenance of chromosome element 4 [Suillus tomentosus]
MMDILEAMGPLNLFRFIINPESFGQSVENLYFLSVLFHEGMCGLRVTDAGEPMVWRTLPSDKCDTDDQIAASRQMVMEFDMATWKHAIQVFEITQATIPTRCPPTSGPRS